jgi:hypothetical protein
VGRSASNEERSERVDVLKKGCSLFLPRTSENSVKAKFAEFPFHALG